MVATRRRRRAYRRARAGPILLQGPNLAQDFVQFALQVGQPGFDATRRTTAKSRTFRAAFAVAAWRCALRATTLPFPAFLGTSVAIAPLLRPAIILPPLAARRAFAPPPFPRLIVGQQITAHATYDACDKQAQPKSSHPHDQAPEGKFRQGASGLHCRQYDAPRCLKIQFPLFANQFAEPLLDDLLPRLVALANDLLEPLQFLFHAPELQLATLLTDIEVLIDDFSQALH
jgi:hypothetical protein